MDLIFLIWILLALISAIYIISQKLYQRYKVSRAKLIPKLIEKAERNYEEGNLVNAAEEYVKALLQGLKTNYEYINDLVDCYTYLARNIIYKATFSSKDEDIKSLESIIKLQKTLKQNKPFITSHADKIYQIDTLLEKAQTNDLNFMINAALKDKEFLTSFLEKICRPETEINDLASRLHYTNEVIEKLLWRCIEEKRIEGYLTLDKQKFISKYQLTKLLYEKIKEVN